MDRGAWRATVHAIPKSQNSATKEQQRDLCSVPGAEAGASGKRKQWERLFSCLLPFEMLTEQLKVAEDKTS